MIGNIRKLISVFLSLSIQLVAYAQEADFYNRLSDAAISLTKDKVVYDPRYYTISYLNGDVPADKGVFTDVIVRAYRNWA